MIDDILEQIGLALLFYFAVVGLFRVAGKRFAGQTTTFDLIVLISLAVAVQKITLRDGDLNTVVFLVTVFVSHLAVGALCRRVGWIRHLVRGEPCLLVNDGEILYQSLRSEGMTQDELLAGLRKLGIEDVTQVAHAHLEETGQISAVKRDARGTPQPRINTQVAQPEF
jgi:uncharacterized membrane protein YcaP (DUF421 family)